MKRTINNPFLKDTVTFMRTSAESGGAVTELEATVMLGASSPPHFHTTYDETITALEGRILIQLSKGEEVELTAGQSYLIKAGQVHGLRNITEAQVRVRSRITPGSQGFEDALRIMYGLASDGLYNERKMPRSFQHFAVCASISDTRLPGLAAMLNPLIDIVARFARWRGVEQRLRRKYCV
jgi:quercetin dioxygenase-like cupin family protein